MPVVYPDGQVIGYYILAGRQWVGPFLKVSA
jgi:hypothetical protein